MDTLWQNSVLLIRSNDPGERSFGTGFVIYNDKQATYILTCTHVVREIGGPEKIQINDIQARVVASSPEEDADLAILRVEGLLALQSLPLSVVSQTGNLFSTAGFQQTAKQIVIRELHGTLGKQVGIQMKGPAGRIKAWDLEIIDKDLLQSGYSGSPIVDTYNHVIGVVTTQRGEGKTGVAISVEALEKIWPDLPAGLFVQRIDIDLENLIQKLKNRRVQIKHAKINDEQDYDFGKLPLSELRRRTEQHNNNIQDNERKIQDAESQLQLQKQQVAASSRVITITYFSEGQPARFLHFETDEIFIGRSVATSTQFTIENKKETSSPYARIYQRGDGWWIEDLNSKGRIVVDNITITGAVRLTVGSIFKVGDTLLTINYGDATEKTDEFNGRIKTEFEIHETLLPASVTEQDRLVLRSQISPILQNYQGQDLLERLVQMLLTLYPDYEEKRASIALYHNGTVIFPAYFPADRSYASTTLTYYAINSRKAFIWDENLGLDRPTSAMDMASAMYAPLLSNYRAYGAIHLDTTSLGKVFSRQDLEKLTELTKIIAPKVIAASANTLTSIPSVFLSYSHKDTEFMKSKLVPDLRRRRVDVWWDDSLQIGEDWQKQINDAIRGTDVFCLILSQFSIDSAHVQREIDKAKQYKKPIIPLFQSDASLPEKYQYISKIQYCFINKQYDMAIDQLVNRLYILKSKEDQDTSHDI